jgi:hypothetical protein
MQVSDPFRPEREKDRAPIDFGVQADRAGLLVAAKRQIGKSGAEWSGERAHFASDLRFLFPYHAGQDLSSGGIQGVNTTSCGDWMVFIY